MRNKLRLTYQGRTWGYGCPLSLTGHNDFLGVAGTVKDKVTGIVAVKSQPLLPAFLTFIGIELGSSELLILVHLGRWGVQGWLLPGRAVWSVYPDEWINQLVNRGITCCHGMPILWVPLYSDLGKMLLSAWIPSIHLLLWVLETPVLCSIFLASKQVAAVWFPYSPVHGQKLSRTVHWNGQKRRKGPHLVPIWL